MTLDSASALTIAQRLEALPPNARLAALIARISAGGWFEFYDLFMSGYIALGLVRSGLFGALGFGLASLAGFAASGFAGMFAGTLLFGWICDRFGRKATFGWSLVFYSLMTFGMALAPSAQSIDALRLLAGVGIGVQIITIDAYISEVTPKAARGRFIALSQAISYSAVPVVAFVAYLAVPHTIAGLGGWRWVALASASGAVLAWPIQVGLVESPRWLQSRGRERQALEALTRIERWTGAGPATRFLDEPQGRLQGMRSTRTAALEADDRSALGRMWNRIYRSRTLMLMLFNVFQTVGFYGFAAWVPLLLYQSGVTFVRSLEYTFVIAIVTPLGPLLAMRFADAVERKFQIAVLAGLSAAFVLAFAHARQPWAIITFGTLITLANTWFSCAFHTYQSELYPTKIRASAVGFVYSWSRLSSILVGYLVTFMLKKFSSAAAFESIAASMVIGATVIALFGPRTNRRQLEVLAP